MKKNKIILLMVATFCLIFSGLYFLPVQAETVGDVQLVNPLGGTDDKPEGVTNINILLGNVVGQVLKILGSLALVAFVVGGFLWLTSAGNAEKVKSGTNTMLYAIIGLFVIFASYAILNTVLNGLTSKDETSSNGTAGVQTKTDSSGSGSQTTGVASTSCTSDSVCGADKLCLVESNGSWIKGSVAKAGVCYNKTEFSCKKGIKCGSYSQSQGQCEGTDPEMGAPTTNKNFCQWNSNKCEYKENVCVSMDSCSTAYCEITKK